MDSVHNVTIKFSASFDISIVFPNEPVFIVGATPEAPRVAMMTVPEMMQNKLKIMEHATPTRAYLRLVRLRS
jgi:hypothetical protein